MEPHAFWSELSARFSSLADRAGELRIQFEDVALDELATDLGDCVASELHGRGAAPPNYPTWLYHPDQSPRLLVDAAGEIALRARDDWWSDRPYRPHEPDELNTAENRRAKAVLTRQVSRPQAERAATGDMYRVVRKAAHAAGCVLEGTETLTRCRICRPSLATAGTAVLSEFRSACIHGAIGADLVDSDASDDAALDAWLLALRNGNVDEAVAGRRGVVVAGACAASIALCRQLETRAYRNAVTQTQVNVAIERTEEASRTAALRRRLMTGLRLPTGMRLRPRPDRLRGARHRTKQR